MIHSSDNSKFLPSRNSRASFEEYKIETPPLLTSSCPPSHLISNLDQLLAFTRFLMSSSSKNTPVYNQQSCRVVYNGAINGSVCTYTTINAVGNYGLLFAPNSSQAEASPSRSQAEQSQMPSSESHCCLKKFYAANSC
jgi:hypothetical protein